MVSNRIRNIAFLSTYPPRECGLATFTQDLVRELDKISLLNKPAVIAVSNDRYNYSKRVIMEISQFDRESYTNAARAVNDSDIELLVIEHEYGIFGGEAGEYIIDFINSLKIPFITTLHTVLPSPSEKQKEVLEIIGKKSAKIVTMAKNTVPILESVYDIPSSKIEVIPHGVPYRIVESREKLKEKHGFSGRTVISTFGLISPGKGLEYGIEAIAKVAEKHKDVIYLILGQTHPVVKKEHGESYREKLIELVERLGIKEHVMFVDKYLTKDEIITYLQMSDIYMTPYLGKDQAVSGTLAYAVGYGRVIVSTPYSYAKEMLADGKGLLAEFRDAGSLAEKIMYVLDNPKAKKEMEKRTLSVGMTMMWGNIANQYTKLFIDTLEKSKFQSSMVV
ncbi:glycosyl transferase group 1 [Thermoclostridium stercorarium subsp. stercorarium DSM 8532]|jgi:glycosyltransferase involved in cell wall biosynthesis|uniref:Glycosyl transferase group 1 n=3 Tax=Thermoclostridium stercorarium TaxID=1510 RepID=L7VGJ9_THES1|nr:glycosyltransferase family 4 protein [Thermoclostridium stercorarium]AGC67100.1 glycosyl transferase group 1 [Thermoclostridium stercorarium subsp. stercorarium DSM 8532]AGI38182.1 glycosyltransferase [Thermoclostridium stercorarium subsp. stercorarium DSM 8532]ANW97588.1 glycosyl transferase family 1 [Thermoclostridium stercorarium subsp. thermolacticum DSM 2910]ANX00147.1 glycosyl transferase family 1 [Thermoclostridium stercorarium subsp. leptospartum DSM 9219]UZQ85705.1 glycosyltransfer